MKKRKARKKPVPRARAVKKDRAKLKKAAVRRSAAKPPRVAIKRVRATAMATPASDTFTQNLDRVIALLESYGQVDPITPATRVGPASPSLNRLTTDVNAQWTFPEGKSYVQGTIQASWTAQSLARDMTDRGGV